jgi:uncharacterized membrane protein YfcA
VFLLAVTTGIVGGTYGVGGGSIVAPAFVSLFGLPVHAVAGAVLLGTFTTSLVGTIFFQLVAPWYAAQGVQAAPDWQLGALLGLGGMIGIYLGARCQRYVPERALKIMLAVVVFSVAIRYVTGLWRS